MDMSVLISTEPILFQGMIRLRIGLIIQVMIGELKRTLFCTVEEATDHLLNLSPFEIKILLQMILSGRELGVASSAYMIQLNNQYIKILDSNFINKILDEAIQKCVFGVLFFGQIDYTGD